MYLWICANIQSDKVKINSQKIAVIVVNSFMGLFALSLNAKICVWDMFIDSANQFDLAIISVVIVVFVKFTFLPETVPIRSLEQDPTKPIRSNRTKQNRTEPNRTCMRCRCYHLLLIRMKWELKYFHDFIAQCTMMGECVTRKFSFINIDYD